MPLSTHHRLAVAWVACVAALAAVDAVSLGLTGRPSVFAEGSGVRWALMISALTHGVAYAALVNVLVREQASVSSVSSRAATVRRVLLLCLGMLAVKSAILAPLVGDGQGRVDGPLGTLVWALNGLGLLGLVVGSLVLGLELLRAGRMAPSAWLLSAVIPVALATLVLGLVVPAWANEALLETTMHLGLALVGVETWSPASVSVRRDRLGWPRSRSRSA